MHLDQVQARVGSHDGGDALCYCVLVGGHVDVVQLVRVDNRVVLIDALHCPSIPDVVFGTGGDLGPRYQKDNRINRKVLSPHKMNGQLRQGLPFLPNRYSPNKSERHCL